MDRADRMRNVSAFMPSMVARLGVLVKNHSQLGAGSVDLKWPVEWCRTAPWRRVPRSYWS